MASNWRGRSSSARSASGSYPNYGTQPASSKWGKPSTTKRTAAGAATGYKNVCTSLQRKLDSFKTLFNQTKGPAKFTRPTPATINSFCNWVNKGAVVQTVSPGTIARWARLANQNFNTQNPTPSACKTVLCGKFGRTTIKAVARTKSGQFMVATSPTWKGKSFKFPV